MSINQNENEELIQSEKYEDYFEIHELLFDECVKKI